MNKKTKNNFHNLKFQQQQFLEGIKNFKGEKDILKALKLAEKAHKGQKRDEGGDYIIHPIRAANYLIYDLEIADSDVIIAALLHDVVEDTNLTVESIQEEFGLNVAEYVESLTRDRKTSKYEKHKQLMKESKEVRILKSIDCLDNMKSYPLRKDRGKRFFRHLGEAEFMSIPLAETVNKEIADEMRKLLDKLKEQLSEEFNGCPNDL